MRKKALMKRIETSVNKYKPDVNILKRRDPIRTN